MICIRYVADCDHTRTGQQRKGIGMAKQDGAAPFDLKTSATHLLHRAQQAAVNQSASALAAKGLTIRQFAVLAALFGQEDQSQSRLVETTGIDRSTLADMVSRMEKSGLIKRVVSKSDARAKAVSLSAAGRKAYEDAAPEVQSADSVLMSGLRKSSRGSLINALSVIAGEASEKKDKKRKKTQKAEKKKKKKKK